VNGWNYPAPDGSDGTFGALAPALPTVKGVLDKIVSTRAENNNHRTWCHLVISVAPHLPNGATIYEQDGDGRVRWISTPAAPNGARIDQADSVADR